jgi:hypothetical protein
MLSYIQMRLQADSHGGCVPYLFCCCCRNVAVNFDQGGMPWTCLPGEPSNVNWCNSAQGEELYKNPPQAWLGANDHGESETSPLYLCLLSVLPRMLLDFCCMYDLMTGVAWSKAF